MYEWVTVAFGRLQTIDLREALKRQEGQTVTEYTLVLAFVAIALAAVLVALKGNIQGFIDDVGDALDALPGFGS
jgi:Flp pilus assembly pilin Flp